MTSWNYILRGIRHYRLSYLGVLAGSILGAAVLLGALFAGDSVKGTLKRIAGDRIGQIDFVFAASEGFFRDALAEEVGSDSLLATPVLFLKGQVNDPGSGRSSGAVQLLGIKDSFWELAPDSATSLQLGDRDVAVNRHLADSLGLEIGQAVVMRLQEPGLLSRDAPLSGEAEDVISFRGTIRHIVDAPAFGRFSLEASQLPVPSVFLPIKRLQEIVEQPAKANLLLIDPRAEEISHARLREEIRRGMALEDYGLELLAIEPATSTEIRSDRIFLEPSVVAEIRKRIPEAQPVISYLANTLAANGRSNPYSMVSATTPEAAPFLPADLAPDEIVINGWLAEDLGAAVGDALNLTYFTLGAGNILEETTAPFRIRGVVPLEGLAADRNWMPDFPGVAEAENAEDWTPGLPLDLDRIRQKDEDYWDEHRGTPKAFLALKTGQELFANRWGDSTSLRIPNRAASQPEIQNTILQSISPKMAGLHLQDLRREALAAAQSPVDIAGLFLGMSFFLITAAVSLTAMLFRFNIDQRNEESGLLATLGIPPRLILRWRLLEGLTIVSLGSLIGLGLAIAYSIGILRFLDTIWSSGGAHRMFSFHLNPLSVITGLIAFVLISMGAIWLAVRKQSRQSAALRLEAGMEEAHGVGKRPLIALAAAVLCLAGGFGSLFLAGPIGPQGAYFLSGVAFLMGGLFCYRAWIAKNAMETRVELDPRDLAAMNSARRPSRSMAVVGILASGVFLVISVTAFQKHSSGKSLDKSSGTGGYAFWIETTSSINRPATATVAPDYFELGEKRSTLGAIQPFRIGAGDDASCFNLNTAARPRLLATDVSALQARGSFKLKKAAPGLDPAEGWRLLESASEPRVLRAFIDETTMMWALKRKLGDRIPYLDESGKEFEVEIAGTLADSIFQGSFLVDEKQFLDLFPSQEGYRLFLADASGDLDSRRAAIQRALADRGASVSFTGKRLEDFHAVENTYIAIFHVLGGLGLILGCAGLGIVTARNLAERRSEFEVLGDIGVPRHVSRRIIFSEIHSFIAWSLVIGIAAAVVAILPALSGTPPVKTLAGLGVMVAAIALNSLLLAWIGYRIGMRAVRPIN